MPRATYDDHVERLKRAHLATVRNFAFFFPAVDVLGALAVALVLVFGASGVLDETFTYGEFFQFYLLIDRFFEPIRNLSENLNMMLQAIVSGERVFQRRRRRAADPGSGGRRRGTTASRAACGSRTSTSPTSRTSPCCGACRFEVPAGTHAGPRRPHGGRASRASWA